MNYMCSCHAPAPTVPQLSCGQSETKDHTNKGEEHRKWGWKSSGSISYTLQGGLEQKCFCAPFFHAIFWQKRKGRGLCIHSFSLLMYSLLCSFLSLLVVQTGWQVGLKLLLKIYHHHPPLPPKKNPSPCFKFGGALNDSAVLMRVFMYLISSQIETGMLELTLDCD